MRFKSYLSVLISATFGDFEKKKYDETWNPREELKNREIPPEPSYNVVTPKSPEEMKQAAFDFLEEAAINGAWTEFSVGFSSMTNNYRCEFKGRTIEYSRYFSMGFNMYSLGIKPTGKFHHEPYNSATFTSCEEKLSFLNANENEYLTRLVDENVAERKRKAEEKKTREILIGFLA